MLTDDTSDAQSTPPNIPVAHALIPTLAYGVPQAPFGITVGRAFFISLQYVLFQFAIAIPLGVVIAILAYGQRSMPGPMTTAIVNLGAAVLTLKINEKWAGGRWGDVLPLKKIPYLIFLPMALCMIGLHFLLTETENVLQFFLPIPKWVDTAMQQALFSPSAIWVSVLVLVVIAPITEELLFRGLLLPGMLRLYKVRTSILVTATLFAFVHLNPWQFPVAFVLGVVLGWWRVRTGSLIPCLFGHAFFNAMPILFDLIFNTLIPGYNDHSGHNQLQPMYLNISAAILTIIGFAFLAWTFRRLLPPTSTIPVAASSNHITH